MPHPKASSHCLHSVGHYTFSEIEQRLDTAEITERPQALGISQSGLEEPEERAEVGPGLEAAEPVSPILLPDEIIEDQLASYLTRGEFNASINTHPFFAGNETLCQARRNAERPFKMAVGSCSTLQCDAFGPLIEWGYNKLDPIEHPIKLISGEWIREVVAGAGFNLLLTNCGVMVNGDCPFILLCEPVSSAEGFNKCRIDLKPGERIIKIAASDTHYVLLTSEKQVLVCGFNEYGQLGLADQLIQKGFKKLDLALLDNEWVVDVAVGEKHTLLRTNKNRVLVSGDNESGQLGIPEKNAVHLFEPCSLTGVLRAKEDIKSMAVGSFHSVLLTTSNRMLVSGCNMRGQLSLGDSVHGILSFTECIIADLKPGESIERVVTGDMHTIVLTNHHRLFVCGHNGNGQLGLQSRNNQYQFTECPIDCLQTNEVIIDVTVGFSHTLLTTNKKRVLASGANDYGQLGLGYCNEGGVFTFQASRIPTHYKPSIPLEQESKEEEPVRASHKRKTPTS